MLFGKIQCQTWITSSVSWHDSVLVSMSHNRKPELAVENQTLIKVMKTHKTLREVF